LAIVAPPSNQRYEILFGEIQQMSWVNDLASSLGIPAAAATLAGAMYAACVAAEKAARPEALNDIGRALKDPSWERSVRPPTIIERIFHWTFGERHLSWRCFLTSCGATFIFFLVMALLNASLFWNIFLMPDPLFGFHWHTQQIYHVILIGFVADYISLWKARIIVRYMSRQSGTRNATIMVALDIFGSVIISIIIATIINTAELQYYYYNIEGSWYYSLRTSMLRTFDAWLNLPSFLSGTATSGFTDFQFLLPSTLLTSIWSILILLSTTFLKLLTPIHRFTAWFFNVEKHPVEAIGVVSGALVMIGSLIWSLVRAVF
jgi:hypothetical protein